MTRKIEVASGETDMSGKVLEVVKAEINMEEDTVIGEVEAFSKPSCPVTFWRPWEDRSEATSVSEWSSEATTLLGDEPVTPPLLVTASRRSPMAQAKNTARLLSFHHKCEERGLPPSRLQEETRQGRPRW